MTKHKYNAKKTYAKGFKFDSQKEAKRYCELELLEKAGLIKNLKKQVRYDILMNGEPVKYESGRTIYYLADFEYFDIEKKRKIIEDVKGMDTPVSKIKRALVERSYKIKIDII